MRKVQAVCAFAIVKCKVVNFMFGDETSTSCERKIVVKSSKRLTTGSYRIQTSRFGTGKGQRETKTGRKQIVTIEVSKTVIRK
jgi:hypothetical protein